MKLSTSDWIAIVFGVITTLGLLYSILSKWYDNKEKLEVKKSYGFLTYENRISEEYYLFLECINHGQKTVMLSSCFLRLPDNKTIPAFHHNPLGMNFPFSLDSGNNFKYLFNADDLESTLQKNGYEKDVKLIPVFTTQTGKEFNGRAFDLLPND
ncbi:hypothetical protein KTH46_07565 [Acinetobacter bereziniae]|uniref:hypothetical protein n=1 Tax=Acinetobacter bereziniae TaxID=106648 RepID=UPI0021CE1BD2|nr:hypothetical protein [Acinetobacter bereziniae]MCU4314882.1 hypothetical protein [Acinetobacter bereziniae]